MKNTFRRVDTPSSPARARGDSGEQAAADHLRAKGLRILARNWRNPADLREELDLICDDAGIIVFVEVKTRAATALVPGYHAVSPAKKRILRRACLAWLRGCDPRPDHYRFDIVDVAMTRSNTVVDVFHYECISLFQGRF
ncbi:MAG: YraN family protein [Opitutaceae bacterium]|jgi:putative endonuclease|nr:YraN family protein [Opitutaceae bacterium]